VPGMTKKERVRAALAGEPVDRPPVSMWGHDFLNEWSAEDLAAVTLAQYHLHDWDFIKLNPRWTFFAEAWGNTYEPPSEQRNPRTLTLSVSDAAGLAALRSVDGRTGPFAEQLEALRIVLAEVGDEVDVIQTLFSPLAVTGQLLGRPEDLIALAERDPAATHQAIAAVTATLVDYAAATLEAGAAGVFFAPLVWASHDVCSEAFYREFGRPYDLQLLQTIREADFNVLHVCRNHNMIDLLLDYPVAAVNWAEHGEGNPSLADVWGRTDKAVMGGIDQTRLDEMVAVEVEASAQKAAAVGSSRLFVTPGCSIPPTTPEANRTALVTSIRG
jgi:uroporphyrinogen decarboxylase